MGVPMGENEGLDAQYMDYYRRAAEAAKYEQQRRISEWEYWGANMNKSVKLTLRELATLHRAMGDDPDVQAILQKLLVNVQVEA